VETIEGQKRVVLRLVLLVLFTVEKKNRLGKIIEKEGKGIIAGYPPISVS